MNFYEQYEEALPGVYLPRSYSSEQRARAIAEMKRVRAMTEPAPIAGPYPIIEIAGRRCWLIGHTAAGQPIHMRIPEDWTLEPNG